MSSLGNTSVSNNTSHFIEYFATETSNFLNEKFTLLEKNSIGSDSKMELLRKFEHYLKVSNTCVCFKPSVELLQVYNQLYQQNKFLSDYFTGFYLKNIGKEINEKQIQLLGEGNMNKDLLNNYTDTLNLSKKIDLLYLFRKNKDLNELELNSLEVKFLKLQPVNQFEKSLLQCVNLKNFIAGYQSGIARLLLYYVYRNNKDENCERFNFL